MDNPKDFLPPALYEAMWQVCEAALDAGFDAAYARLNPTHVAEAVPC